MVSPENRNRLLIKFMDEKHVHSFINEGLLFMNNIQYFRAYEDSEPALRGDAHEGLAASFLPENITLELNGHVFTGLVDKVDLRQCHQDETNIYSMTIISDQDILSSGENGLCLSSNFVKFGNKAIFIGGSDISEFWHRLKNTIDNDQSIYTLEENNIIGRKVSYVERKLHHSQLSVFNKSKEYAWQHEWRLALKQTEHVGPLPLKIGSLADIAHVIDAADLIKESIKFQQKVS
ncbi:hypothetical protein [Neptunomonas antarctica]|uniref:Uncharacterized protein n=1 Tax=Neptunomonas antarctica TaxID=619304 RepID=A0A1N7JAC1_9GAMM|nr:hypothetical protein [Neptunomonas antarctica]SIS46211.1 hypothetical protein SAMN05421760_101845 [Neptunomonas antarctica]